MSTQESPQARSPSAQVSDDGDDSLLDSQPIQQRTARTANTTLMDSPSDRFTDRRHIAYEESTRTLRPAEDPRALSRESEQARGGAPSSRLRVGRWSFAPSIGPDSRR